jgi:hypothetical protein
VDLKAATRAVSGIAADAVGLLSKFWFWIMIVWVMPGALVYALLKTQMIIAVVAACGGALGLLAWWMGNGVIRRRTVRMVLAGIGSLALAAVYSSQSLLLGNESQRLGLLPLGLAILWAVVGVLLFAAVLSKPGKESL